MYLDWRLSGGARIGQVPCGKDRKDFETYRDLEDHLKGCPVCIQVISEAQMEIERLRKRLAAKGVQA
jgi:hypothetical protein